jgi:hypothetical protein
MIPYPRGLNMASFGVLASLCVVASPVDTRAASLGLRNDVDAPVVVQCISVVNGTIRRGPVHVLHPGQVAWDLIAAPGNKLITIADAKQPTRMLFRDTVPCGSSDLFFSIQADAPPLPNTDDSKAKTNRPLPRKVKLVPAKPPTQPAGSGLPRR